MNMNGMIRNDVEMVSLIPGEEGDVQRQQRLPPPVRKPVGNHLSQLGGGKLKRRSPPRKGVDWDEELLVSLVGADGTPSKPLRRRPRKSGRGKSAAGNGDAWTMTLLAKYLSLSLFSAVLTFLLLHKGRTAMSYSTAMDFSQFATLLNPEMDGESRCFVSDGDGKDGKCSCPDPTVPVPINKPEWKKYHDKMYSDAVAHRGKELDVVLLGDDIVKVWNQDNMTSVFERKFTKSGGGTLEGFAMGSSGDTGPNILWHLNNGMLAAAKPKVWLIVIGSNDLYQSKCADRFVLANIMNVLRAICEDQPDAKFVLHGILPRTDRPSSETMFLGDGWQRAQEVNSMLKKFSEKKSNVHYIQGGPLFMKEWQKNAKVTERREIDPTKMESDGKSPTEAGLEVWGDYIAKEVSGIIRK